MAKHDSNANTRKKISAQPRLHQLPAEIVSQVLRTNELQVWFLSEHLVNVPLVMAENARAGVA